MARQDGDDLWAAFYQWVEGRPPRPLFLAGIERCEREMDRTGRRAIDLGCGDGTETLVLLQHDWHVLAVDQAAEAMGYVRAKVTPEQLARLEIKIAAFDQIVLPSADFVYAGLSLPFCPPEHFHGVWAGIVASIRPGGRFAGHLFGDQDSWAKNPAMTFHTLEQVPQLFQGFDIEHFLEINEDGTAFTGPKHWHIFEVIARKTER